MHMLICTVVVEISRVTCRRKYLDIINLFLTISLFSHIKNYVTFHINEHHFSLFKGYLHELWLKLASSFSRKSQTSQKKVTTYDRILSENLTWAFSRKVKGAVLKYLNYIYIRDWHKSPK